MTTKIGPWTCYAVPAHTGQRCGHLNERADAMHFQGRRVEYCGKCGCTKIASDDRRRKLEARAKATALFA